MFPSTPWDSSLLSDHHSPNFKTQLYIMVHLATGLQASTELNPVVYLIERNNV